MNKIITAYRNRYYISPADLADSAETNRLHLLFISPFLFLFGAVMLPVYLIIYKTDLSNHFSTLLYYGSFIFVSIYMYIHSRLVKNAPREKAFVLKNIPFYVALLFFLSLGTFNFYDANPFNGVITCGLNGIIALCVFSFSPILFFLILFVYLCIMAPGLIENYDVTGLLNVILTVILMFCLALYKRRSEKKIIMLLKTQKQSLVAKTFGSFTLLYNNQVIKFSRSKSEELVAYLIYKNGCSVKTKELITALYGKSADSSRYGSNIRNLIVDIKHTLADLDIQNFFITEYNNFRINPDVIKCDYYDFLAGDKETVKNFAGQFMSQYDWAENVNTFMEYKVLANPKASKSRSI